LIAPSFGLLIHFFNWTKLGEIILHQQQHREIWRNNLIAKTLETDTK
jgi:hypothetical protein